MYFTVFKDDADDDDDSALPIYRGRKQHREGREAGVKGTGSGRAGYVRWEVLTLLSPPHQILGNLDNLNGSWASKICNDLACFRLDLYTSTSQ